MYSDLLKEAMWLFRTNQIVLFLRKYITLKVDNLEEYRKKLLAITYLLSTALRNCSV